MTDTSSESAVRSMLAFKVQSIEVFKLSPLHFAVEKLMLDHGTLMRGRPLPKGYKYKQIKMCFRNAANMALDNPNLTYVEGFANRADLPIEFRHAWLLDKDGKVVDPTWRNTTEKEEYLGLSIPTKLLRKLIVKNESWSVFWLGIMEIPNFELVDQLRKQLDASKPAA